LNALRVDDLHLEVRCSARRKTVGLTVDRDGQLVLHAPTGCSAKTLEEFVREKRFWIYGKLAEKEALRPPAVTKEYVSGEGFPYLGRSYRLLLVPNQDVAVKLEHARFKMRAEDAREGRAHMIRWYVTHAEAWLVRKVEQWTRRVGVEPGGVQVRDLGYRWGSCGKGGRLYFHWKSITLPPSMAEYVVVHELVHLHEPHHTPEFWVRLERAMPDCEARRAWLSEHGGGFGL
jgi:predicted metal-dependent hydrolase